MKNVILTRRVSFSSGHRYWLPSLSEEENRGRFGRWASPYNHGHNYVLDVSVRGPVDSVTGMVVNIKDIDDMLKQRIVNQFDGKSINDEVPAFLNRAPSIENLLMYLWERLALSKEESPLPPGSEIVSMRLEETPTFYGELTLDKGKPKMTLTRSYEFAAAHRLHVPAFTPELNVEMFGKCNNEAGHGHNYIVEVTVSGDPDPTTGMLVDLERMDEIVSETVVERYDHKNLNVDIPELLGQVPTSEIVTLAIFDSLQGKLPAKLERVRLHETGRNVFEVCTG